MGRSAYGRIRCRRLKDLAVQRGGECCKDYPELGYRSIFYPYSSVGNAFTITSQCSTTPNWRATLFNVSTWMLLRSPCARGRGGVGVLATCVAIPSRLLSTYRSSRRIIPVCQPAALHTPCATIVMDYRVVRDRTEEAVRDLALAELSLSVGAAVTVFSELVPLLRWGSLGCDRVPDQVRSCFVRAPPPYFRTIVASFFLFATLKCAA